MTTFGSSPVSKTQNLDALVEHGLLHRLQVQGWSAPAYVHNTHAGLLQKALGGKLTATCTTLLSPFDPLVWDRERASTMFSFDYRIECYTPAEKRTYGYFVLPILHRGELIGRLDAKAHRALGVFEVKALYLDPGVLLSERSVAEVAQAIRRCAVWHGTPDVKVVRTAPAGLRASLRKALSEMA